MGCTIQQISSLEKVRLTDEPSFTEIDRKTAFRGERFSYQIALFDEGMSAYRIGIESAYTDWITLYAVKNAVMDHPIYKTTADDGYLTREPGLMPDILMPLDAQNGIVQTLLSRASCLWVRVDIPQDAAAGPYDITVTIRKITEEEMKSRRCGAQEEPVRKTMHMEVLPIALPAQKLIYTQWFYADCIANAHQVEIYSENHWKLIDKYMACAADMGINMLLTPVITPPLDTMYGVHRPNVQLLEIEKVGESYRFDFSRLHRWIALCKKNHIEYYEICPLFSQWGMKFAPNIWVTEGGEQKLLFGWHTPADSAEYLRFLSQMVPALIEVLEIEGVKEHSFFHVSDEPKEDHLADYARFSSFLAPLIQGCKRMDALSNYSFYARGLVEIPVTASNHIQPFLDHHLENQWVYYCMGQREGVSNRFLAMPSYRNRIMGLQMYRMNVKGFLQWGFNYYYSRCSGYPINPYQTTSSDLTFPSGDPFSVYPGENGPILSLRALVFYEGLQDLLVCQLLEEQIGRPAVEKMIDDAAGMELKFDAFPRSAEYINDIREKMTNEIAARMAIHT